MKKLAPFILVVLAACGSSSDAAHTLASGSYLPSKATANLDQCRMIDAFRTNPTTFPVTVAADGKSGTLNFSSAPVPAGSNIVVAINGNSIATTTKASYQVVDSATCTFLEEVDIKSGELLANNDAHLIVRYVFTNVTGSQCTAQGMAVDQLPCTSEIDFEAVKQ